MSTLTVPLPRPRQALQPECERDAERCVAISTEITASTSVCLSAELERIVVEHAERLVGPEPAQRRSPPRPCASARRLKAKRIAMITGTTDQMM